MDFAYRWSFGGGGFAINGATLSGFSASLQLKATNSFTKMFLWIFFSFFFLPKFHIQGLEHYALLDY